MWTICVCEFYFFTSMKQNQSIINTGKWPVYVLVKYYCPHFLTTRWCVARNCGLWQTLFNKYVSFICNNFPEIITSTTSAYRSSHTNFCERETKSYDNSCYMVRTKRFHLWSKYILTIIVSSFFSFMYSVHEHLKHSIQHGHDSKKII